MGNQQVSLEQRKPQRLFSLREVHNKRLVMEVVCPTIVGEDIVCTLSKDKGSYDRVSVAACLNTIVFSIVIPSEE